MGIKALKKFGQNYLIDKNIVRKMINALEIQKTDSILEIGPGKGFITEELVNLSNDIVAIEIDTRVIKELTAKLSSVRIYNDDFLKININNLFSSNHIKVIGNIPFNQTGNILFRLIELRELVIEAVLIIPLDIAKRIVAKKRTKEYGILTVLFNLFSDAKIIQKLSKNVFLPKPNIEASIIHLKFNKVIDPAFNSKLFMQVVKAAFGNRRKTLYNSFRNSIFIDCDFSIFGSLMKKRAEELELQDYIELTNHIDKNKCQK